LDEKNDMELYAEYRLNTEFFKRLVLVMNHSTKPFDVNFEKKMRVTIDYDPQEIQVKFNYFVESEQTQEEQSQ
jgi:hypothetical protein